ncbi:MAG: hypothetical protein WC860_07435 [Candidatus Margulisiibacteriota bacterium]
MNKELIPSTVTEKLNKLLQYLNSETDYFGKKIAIDFDLNYPIIYGSHENKNGTNELISIIKAAENENLISTTPMINRKGVFASLTLKGAEFINKVEKEIKDTCFVAMWFNEETNLTWKLIEDIIDNDLKKYEIEKIRIDNVHHNNLIDDEIIASIKKSKFVIADLTGYRGGVYYEIGYAHALNKEVILLCREDWFKDKKDENEKIIQEGVHFDLNHRNILIYDKSNPPNLINNQVITLKETLKNRILNTILT